MDRIRRPRSACVLRNENCSDPNGLQHAAVKSNCGKLSKQRNEIIGTKVVEEPSGSKYRIISSHHVGIGALLGVGRLSRLATLKKWGVVVPLKNCQDEMRLS